MLLIDSGIMAIFRKAKKLFVKNSTVWPLVIQRKVTLSEAFVLLFTGIREPPDPTPPQKLGNLISPPNRITVPLSPRQGDHSLFFPPYRMPYPLPPRGGVTITSSSPIQDATPFPPPGRVTIPSSSPIQGTVPHVRQGEKDDPCPVSYICHVVNL